MDVEALRRDWVGFEIDTSAFEVRQQDTLTFARACGEVDPRYVDPDHPDFQAPPTYPSRFSGRRILPADFPRMGFGFDAGKCVLPRAPIRIGDTLTGRSTVHDFYEKTGRSGAMLFLVHRMEFVNQRGEHVSTVDWRLVSRPGSRR